MSTRAFCPYALAIAVLFLLAVTRSYAQEDDATTDVDDAVQEEILVVGVRSSIRNALINKENETRVTDSIQAEDLGEFPDLNLAEALQRVPGVTLERSVSGNSRTITVRGLSSQFTRVEINRMGGATGGGGRSGRIDTATRTAGQDGRNFNFDILPSELFTSAVIAKSPQASDTEGAIAALVELTTPSPFDLDEQSGSVTLQANWNEVSGTAPRASGIFSTQLNDQFAFLIGGVYGDQASDTSQIGFDRFVPLGSSAADASALSDAHARALVPRGYNFIGRNRQTDNYSVLGTLEWRLNGGGNIRFDAIHADSSGEELEGEGFYDLTRGVGTPSSIQVSGGVVTDAQFPSFRRSQVQFRSDGVEDTLRQYTGMANFDILQSGNSSWVFSPFIGYNERVIERAFNEFNYFGGNGSFGYSLSNGIDRISTSAPGFDSNPDNFVLGNALRAYSEGKLPPVLRESCHPF